MCGLGRARRAHDCVLHPAYVLVDLSEQTTHLCVEAVLSVRGYSYLQVRKQAQQVSQKVGIQYDTQYRVDL
jgi:hypothetical protein